MTDRPRVSETCTRTVIGVAREVTTVGENSTRSMISRCGRETDWMLTVPPAGVVVGRARHDRRGRRADGVRALRVPRRHGDAQAVADVREAHGVRLAVGVRDDEAAVARLVAAQPAVRERRGRIGGPGAVRGVRTAPTVVSPVTIGRTVLRGASADVLAMPIAANVPTQARATPSVKSRFIWSSPLDWVHSRLPRAAGLMRN